MLAATPKPSLDRQRSRVVGQAATPAPDRQARLHFQGMADVAVMERLRVRGGADGHVCAGPPGLASVPRMAGVDAGRRPGGPPHFHSRLFRVTFV